jgi:hypothetical protein
MKRPLDKKNSDQKGVFLVLLAILLFAIVGLTVAVIGLGLLSTSKTKFLDSTNLAALAALEAYVNSPNPTLGHDARVVEGIDRAKQILSANRLPGTQNAIQNIGDSAALPGTAGYAAFGTWHQTRPIGLDPCSGAYPCFVEGLPPNPINAVKLDIKTEPGDPVSFPLGNFFGINGFNVSATSLAAIVPRCAAYVMDLSTSVQFETHKPYRAAGQHPCWADSQAISSCVLPATPLPTCCDALFSPYCAAFPDCSVSQVILTQTDSGPNPDEFGFSAIPTASLPPGVPPNCQLPLTGLPNYGSQDAIVWCNYPEQRDLPYSDPGGNRHFKDDYESETSPIGPGGTSTSVYVDKFHEPPFYRGPQPFSNNMLAFNAGLRRMLATQSGTDSSLVVMFSDVIRDREPNVGLTNDLGYLIQLTNLDNGGRRIYDPTSLQNIADPANPEIHPNFIDKGWLPLASNANTNIVLAINTAAAALANFCPSLSSKAIILATDGVSSCYLGSDGISEVCPTAGSPSNIGFFQRAERQLLNTPINASIPNMRELLRQWEISLTTIIDGEGVRPNIFNIASNLAGCGPWQPGIGYATEDPKCYLSYEEARALGYGGFQGSTSNAFVNTNSLDENGAVTGNLSATYNEFMAGTPGVVFGRPLGIFTQLAVDTGGFICPMLNPGPTSSYVDFYQDRGLPGASAPCDSDLDSNPTNDCDKANYACSPCVLRSQYRRPCTGGASCGESNTLTVAPLLQSKAEQAAACARVAVGLNPYTLVSE